MKIIKFNFAFFFLKKRRLTQLPDSGNIKKTDDIQHLIIKK